MFIKSYMWKVYLLGNIWERALLSETKNIEILKESIFFCPQQVLFSENKFFCRSLFPQRFQLSWAPSGCLCIYDIWDTAVGNKAAMCWVLVELFIDQKLIYLPISLDSWLTGQTTSHRRIKEGILNRKAVDMGKAHSHGKEGLKARKEYEGLSILSLDFSFKIESILVS